MSLVLLGFSFGAQVLVTQNMEDNRFKAIGRLCRDLLLFLILLLYVTHTLHLPVIAARARNGAVLANHNCAAEHPETERLVTVSDAIRMTKIGDPEYYWGASSSGRVGQFSPDGKHFVVILRKGNLENNSNDYTLLLWQTNAALHSSAPQALLTMSSTSNLEAIANVKWFQDNHTLIFLGEQYGQVRQLYTFNIRTRALKKLTSHSTNVISYSLSKAGDTIAYVAERPFQSLWDDEARRLGVVVSNQWIADLMTSRKGYDYRRAEGDLFVLDKRGNHRLDVLGAVHLSLSKPYLSPNGHYVVLPTEVAVIPEGWKRYQDDYLQGSIRATASAPVSDLLRYELVDTVTGKSSILLDSPTQFGQVVWLPDGESVVLSSVFLPLEQVTPEEEKRREAHTFTVEASIPDGRVTKISEVGTPTAAWWENGTDRLVLETRNSTSRSRSYFRKHDGLWENGEANSSRADSQAELILDEGMNTPPAIFIRDPQTDHKTFLLNLNPQFKELRFAKVEEVKWKSSEGADVVGGLYYPPDYIPGKRYPLVIQMHGWNPNRFWIDGPSTTAFAAQPLAAKGIMVLQVDDAPLELGRQQDEVKAEVAIIEGAVNYLDKNALIDRARLGIIGWSRSCFFVKYVLTHSEYGFAAAAVSEGEDGGYLQYITNNNFFVDSESLYGGPPFGETLSRWIEVSPGFNIAKVHTPVRITVLNSRLLLLDWEWFEALSQLRKPVEMVMLQDGRHFLQKPWERLVSQQGNVDWFAFWLKSEEDPDPAKALQYARWRELRKLQEQNEKKSANAASTTSN